MTLQTSACVLLCALCSLLPASLRAQDSYSTLFSQPGTVRASTLAPASLQLGPGQKWQINSLSGNLWLANNASSANLGEYFLKGQTLSEDDKSFILDNLPSRIRMSGGLNFTSIGGAYQFDNDHASALSLTVTDRVMGSGQFSDTFVDFMLRGNRHLAGQTVDLADDLLISMQWVREYAVGWAADVPFFDDKDAFRLRFGVRAKLLTGHAATQLKDARARFYTHPDGEYLDADFDYEIYASDRDNDGLFGQFGTGFGADLSLLAEFDQNLQIGVSLLDFGSVNYNQRMNLYKGEGNERYNQLIVGALFFDDRLSGGAEDEGQSFPLAPDTLTGQSVTMALPTRILVNAQMGFGDTGKDDLGRTYHTHNLYLAGTLPVANASGYFAAPAVSVAYAYHWEGRLRIGGSLSHTPFYTLGMGLFAGLDLGSIQAGIGSENLLRIPRWDALAGGDLMLNLAYSF